MRIFQLKACARITRKAKISAEALVEAVTRAENGLIDADLKQGLLKQRVARSGRGRRGGFRMLLALERGERAVFLFGFAKSDRDNLDDDELESACKLCVAWLGASDEQIEQALTDKELIEVKHDDPADQKALSSPA